MQSWETLDSARALSARALELMNVHTVAPTPLNYELWFAYALGSPRELVAAMDAAIRNKRANDDTHLHELHGRFLHAHATAALDEMGAKLHTELQKFATVLEGAGQDTATYGRMLNQASEQLTLGSVDQIQIIVEGLIGATKAIESRHKEVEAELQASSHEIQSLRSRLETVRTESRHDALTGLFNRRGFDERIDMALSAAEKTQEPLCVLIGDIDLFKKVNDTLGHATGDQVLRLVGQCLAANIRETDTAARYGGEEFVVALPGTTLQAALLVAEKIRQAVESKKIVKRSTGESLGSITLSLGVAKFIPGEAIADTINRADQCLYAAKNAGRNRVLGQDDLNATEAKKAIGA